MFKILIYTFIFSSMAFSNVLDVVKSLDKTDIKKISNGKFVLKSKKVNDASWPELEIYSFLPVPPEDAVAIFGAYEYQKKYVPNLLESKVIKVDPKLKTVSVDYELKLPWPLSNSKYTHGHNFDNSEKDKYIIEWFLEKSNSSDEVNGSAQFIKYKNGTLFIYKNFVRPKSIFAGVFKKSMKRDVISSLEATKTQIIKVYQTDKGLLKKFKDLLKNPSLYLKR